LAEKDMALFDVASKELTKTLVVSNAERSQFSVHHVESVTKQPVNGRWQADEVDVPR
jgi:hypothetical protein